MEEKAQYQPQPMKMESEEDIKKDLGLSISEEKPTNVTLDKKADDFLNRLLDNSIDQAMKRKAVDEMGMRTQEQAANLSKMLDEPIKNLAKTGETGGPVAKSLLDLKEQVESLDPINYDFSSASGFMASVSRLLPGGNKLSRYFAKYMSSEAVINSIIKSLEQGKDQLKRDTTTLSQDKSRMMTSMNKLRGTIELGRLLDQKLQYKLDREIAPEDDQHRFVQEELMFPLRQRIIDLQQSLNVTQQGILTIEVIIRNNRELIRGVNRALNVTISALQTAVATALALNNQEVVLKKIEALNQTTSNLIAHNAERLKTQGVKIHKMASESMLDMESLERAFADIKTAMEDISKFRQEALPRMANNIVRLDELNEEAYEAVKKMDRGNAAQSAIVIDLEDGDFEVVK